METLKVGFIVPSFEVGGVETFIVRLAKYLAKHRCTVEVLATERKGEWWDYLQSQGVPSHLIDTGLPWTHIQHILKIGTYLAERNFDILLLNHSRETQMILGMLPRKTIVIPIIHNDNKWVYKTACSNSRLWDAGVAVGPKVLHEAKKRVPHKVIEEIRYGVETPVRSWRKKVKHRNRPKKLLFVGRLTEVKGALLLPEIMAECLRRRFNATLTVVGCGPCLEAMKRSVGELDLAGRVNFLGVLEPGATLKQMKEHQILILPSRYEGLPLTLLEAQAWECVPVVSNLPGTTTAAIDVGRTGVLAEAGNVGSFVDAIGKLINDPKTLRRMGANARNWIQRKYSIDAMGSQYLELFRKAKEGGRRSDTWMKLHIPLLLLRDLIPNDAR